MAVWTLYHHLDLTHLLQEGPADAGKPAQRKTMKKNSSISKL